METELRAVLTGVDDYASSAKPQIDWDDVEAQAELIDSRAKDGFGCLGVLHGRELDLEVTDAAALLATVLGQDLEDADDGWFRIAREVAVDRVISVVDPDARHGHKTSARGFDGYKGHAAVDPDSEIITDTVVSPGNAGDASVAEDLIDDLLHDPADVVADTEPHTPADSAESGPSGNDETAENNDGDGDRVVYGDAAYGTGAFLGRLEDAGIDAKCKTQPPARPRRAVHQRPISTSTCPTAMSLARPAKSPISAGTNTVAASPISPRTAPPAPSPQNAAPRRADGASTSVPTKTS